MNFQQGSRKQPSLACCTLPIAYTYALTLCVLYRRTQDTSTHTHSLAYWMYQPCRIGFILPWRIVPGRVPFVFIIVSCNIYPHRITHCIILPYIILCDLILSCPVASVSQICVIWFILATISILSCLTHLIYLNLYVYYLQFVSKVPFLSYPSYPSYLSYLSYVYCQWYSLYVSLIFLTWLFVC